MEKANSGTEEVVQTEKVTRKRTIVMGDSMVRRIERRFCGRDKDKRMVCCFPGAKIRDIRDRVSDTLKGENKLVQVIVHVGTNDVGGKKGRRYQTGVR